jgi:hypothetical protein
LLGDFTRKSAFLRILKNTIIYKLICLFKSIDSQLVMFLRGIEPTNISSLMHPTSLFLHLYFSAYNVFSVDKGHYLGMV